MEDSKSSRNRILVNSLKGSSIRYEYLRSWFVGFIASNTEINEKNNPEYSGLCQAIRDFYVQSIFMLGVNPNNFLIEDKTDIYRKRHFAKKIENEFGRVLSLLEHISDNGESPEGFTVPKEVFELDSSAYEYLDMKTAIPDH